MTVTVFKDYSVSYSRDSAPVLRGIDFGIGERECIVVSGLSGSGKSTLLLAAAGLIETYPAAVWTGSIERRRNGGDGKTRVAMLLQNFYSQITYLRSTVFEEIAFSCENLGLPREETIRRVTEALDKIRIGHLAQRSPIELSGGEKQKVVLAAALAVRPDLLILDEPMSQLDQETTSYLAAVLTDLKSDMSLLIAENDPYLTQRVADRLVILTDGRIIADGPPASVINDSTSNHIELPAWTLCVDEAVRQGVIPEDGHVHNFELDFRRALSRLRRRP